jgi:hypothetical protein
MKLFHFVCEKGLKDWVLDVNVYKCKVVSTLFNDDIFLYTVDSQTLTKISLAPAPF